MKKEKDIYQQDDFSEEDLKTFEAKLFSPSTPVSELGTICMTLAHLPTRESLKLLKRFKKSERGKEVIWLDSAIEECRFHGGGR
jgi:hypothetical protein